MSSKVDEQPQQYMELFCILFITNVRGKLDDYVYIVLLIKLYTVLSR